MTFIITRPGYSEESFQSEATANEAVEEIYQGVVQADNTFSSTYSLSTGAKSGTYSVYVNI